MFVKYFYEWVWIELFYVLNVWLFLCIIEYKCCFNYGGYICSVRYCLCIYFIIVFCMIVVVINEDGFFFIVFNIGNVSVYICYFCVIFSKWVWVR